jgi:hypothetical protein
VFEKVACCNLKDKKCADLVVYPAQNVANEPFTIESKFRHLPLEVIITGVSDAEGCADENGGTAGLLLECLAACNHDVRAIACAHIVICGGGATIPGLPAAICDLASERTSAASSNSRVRGLQDVGELYNNTLYQEVLTLSIGLFRLVVTAPIFLSELHTITSQSLHHRIAIDAQSMHY